MCQNNTVLAPKNRNYCDEMLWFWYFFKEICQNNTVSAKKGGNKYKCADKWAKTIMFWHQKSKLLS